MSIVTDFKSINRKLNRMEQKAEWDAKNPKVDPAMYGWPYSMAVTYSDSPVANEGRYWVNVKI